MGNLRSHASPLRDLPSGAGGGGLAGPGTAFSRRLPALGGLQALVFGESDPPGLSHIPKFKEEVRLVSGILLAGSVTVANDVDVVPTAQSVLDRLPVAHILHLACYGHQDPEPLQSHFALSDGPLTMSALMKINVPNAMTAFLSACETAKGDKDQPDQAVHLAASMLFCGFRSVVATMW